MIEVHLDKKNLKLLSVVDKDPLMLVSKIAKKIGVSRQVAEYRLHQLEENNTIYAFYTLVDVSKLGYSLFRVHFRLKNVTSQKYETFAQKLFLDYPAMWVGFVSGEFDLIYDLFARNHQEFEFMLSSIIKEHKEMIQSYESFVVLNISMYNYNYFVNSTQMRRKILFNQDTQLIEVDDKDKAILQQIKNNARMPYEAIGRKVGLTRNAVKYRINRLEELKIISGYLMIVDFHHLKKQSFKIFIRYNPQKREQEKDLLDCIKESYGVLATLQLFGKWDLDIEIQKSDIKELQEYIIELRNKFEIIENYSIIPIIRDFGINFFPKNLK